MGSEERVGTRLRGRVREQDSGCMAMLNPSGYPITVRGPRCGRRQGACCRHLHCRRRIGSGSGDLQEKHGSAAPRRALRHAPGQPDMRTIRAPCSASAASSSRRRCAPRSSSASPRSPRPAAPAIGIASARGIGTACAAGDGFAVHRPSHRAMLSHPRRCRPSCRPSCGRCRRCLDHLAAHDCPGSCRHVPPLTRRDGSTLPGSPASFPPSQTLPISCL